MKNLVAATLVILSLTSCKTSKYIYDNKEDIADFIERIREELDLNQEETAVVEKECNHGRLIEWYTPQGKKVQQYESGEFIGYVWTESVKSWPGMSAAYKDKFPSCDIEECEISCLETRVDNRFESNGHFVDNGEATSVPDEVHFYCRTVYTKDRSPAPYLVEFDYGNQRDAIFSLGGLHVLHGPEGDVKFRSQCHHGNAEYKGMRTCLR